MKKQSKRRVQARIKRYTLFDEMAASPTELLPQDWRTYQLTRMYEGLAAMEKAPTPTTDDWRVVSDAVNLMETLIVDMKVCEDTSGLLMDAITAMAMAGKRNMAGGAIRLDGAGIQAVRAVLEDYAALLKPILSGKADAVFGSRFIGSHVHRVLYFWHSLGNQFLTLLSNMTTNLNLTDMEACYKVFKRDLIKSVTLEENRFGIEPEIVAKIAHTGARIYEVAISYHGRTYAEGKKIGWKDGLSALRCILKYGLWRRIFAAPSGNSSISVK
jgi:hypothetical protein